MSAEDSKSERTRRRILDAASALFAAKSFDGVSIRAIAREAGVDAALVHHYFGPKEALFEEVLSAAVTPAKFQEEVLASPADDVGEKLVRGALTRMESPAGPALRAMIRSGITSHQDLLRRFVQGQLLSRVGSLIEGTPEVRERRAVLAGSQMIGLFVARYLVKVEPLASMEREEVVRMVGPTISRYLTGEL